MSETKRRDCLLCGGTFVAGEDDAGFVCVSIRAYYGSRHDCGSDMNDSEWRGVICDDCAAPLLAKAQYGHVVRRAEFAETDNPAISPERVDKPTT